MILQIILSKWDAKMLSILTDLFHVLIFRKKTGYKQMEILE